MDGRDKPSGYPYRLRREMVVEPKGKPGQDGTDSALSLGESF